MKSKLIWKDTALKLIKINLVCHMNFKQYKRWSKADFEKLIYCIQVLEP